MAIRILLAGLFVAVAVGGGLWLHNYTTTGACHLDAFAIGVGHPAGKVCERVHPSWADPLALGGGIAVIALGAALSVGRRPYFAKPS